MLLKNFLTFFIYISIFFLDNVFFYISQSLFLKNSFLYCKIEKDGIFISIKKRKKKYCIEFHWDLIKFNYNWKKNHRLWSSFDAWVLYTK